MSFWLFAAALTVLAVGFIAAPLAWRVRHTARHTPDAATINLALLREQLSELAALHQEGGITDQAFTERRQELEQQLVNDATPRSERASQGNYRPLVLAVALMLPFAAWLLYQQLGSGQAWQLTRDYQSISAQLADGEVDDAEVMAFVGELAQFTRERGTPDWLFLQAELYMQVGAYRAAADSYAQIVVGQTDAVEILARQAQALYLASGRQLDAEVNAVIDRVLALNPHQSTVLGIRGMNAYENADYAVAIENWQQALAGMPPGSGSSQILEQGIRQAQAALGITAPTPGKEQAPGGFTAGIKVRVELDPAARVSPGSTVYVIASAPGGGMPFAVVRLRVEELPVEVTLDDSTAMAPGASLSRQNQVRVAARVSASGNAIAQAGDWQGRSEVLTPDKLPPVVAIRIDQEI